MLLLSLPLFADSTADMGLTPAAAISAPGNLPAYTISVPLEGTPPALYASTLQLTSNTASGSFTGVVSPGRDTTFVLPEPGSLTLLGSGLLGIAIIIRHKLQPPGRSG